MTKKPPPELIEYTAWAKVPDHLKTKTQLNELGKKPAKNQTPEAHFCSYYNGKRRPRYYPLYNINHAIEKRKPTPKQLQNLAKARAEAKRRRTCQRCQTTYSKPLTNFPLCMFCFDHIESIQWAKQVLADPNAIIIDTETTGLNNYHTDHPLEIAIINTNNQTLLNTLVQTIKPISNGATAIHGITTEHLQNAPTFPQIYPTLCTILNNASKIIIYNAPFDYQILENARIDHNLPFYPIAKIAEGMEYTDENHEEQKEPDYCIGWHKLTCAMQKYAEYYGQWSYKHTNYKYQPLNGGHRALSDCQATLQLIEQMAATNDQPPKQP